MRTLYRGKTYSAGPSHQETSIQLFMRATEPAQPWHSEGSERQGSLFARYWWICDCAEVTSGRKAYLLNDPNLLPRPGTDVGGDSLRHKVQLVGVQARIVLLVLDGQAEQVVPVRVGAGRCRDSCHHSNAMPGLRGISSALMLGCTQASTLSEI